MSEISRVRRHSMASTCKDLLCWILESDVEMLRRIRGIWWGPSSCSTKCPQGVVSWSMMVDGHGKICALQFSLTI